MMEDDSNSPDDVSGETSSGAQDGTPNVSSRIVRRGGTVRGKSITGRMSKFEDLTTKSQQKMPVLGANLASLLNFDGQTRTLPNVLKDCLDALREDESNLKSTQLFRSDPDSQVVRSMGEGYWSPNVDQNLSKFEPGPVSMFLLEWLSQLPESLLTDVRYFKFQKSANRADKIAKITRNVKSLARDSCNALQYLLFFLREVSTYSSRNGLTIEEISKIFGPILHRKSGETDQEVENHATVVNVLLSGYHTIFADFTIDDKEEIPEEQLSEDVANLKRKNKMIRSTSTSDVDKRTRIAEKGGSTPPTAVTKQTKMLNSSSAENLAVSSSPEPSPSPSIESIPSDQPSPTSHHESSIEDNQPQADKSEKKGFLNTLRKLGMKKDKERPKSPARSETPVSSPSKSPAPSLHAVFGMPIESLLHFEESENLVPNILRDCVEFLSQEERTKEFGIFRESGLFIEKIRLMQAYDSPNVHIDMTGIDAFTVANLIKEWLRALPDALLPEALYKPFKAAVDADADPSVELKEVVGQMSTERRQVLHYLIHFLKTKVNAFATENMMSEHNVGIVFGPCLHRLQNSTPDELMDPCHHQIVINMLDHYEAIFGEWSLPDLSQVVDKDAVVKKAADLDRPMSALDEINNKVVVYNGDKVSSKSTDSGKISFQSKPIDQSPKTDLKDKKKSPALEAISGGGRHRSATTSGEGPPLQISKSIEDIRKIKRRGSSKSTKRERVDSTPIFPTAILALSDESAASPPISAGPSTPLSSKKSSLSNLVITSPSLEPLGSPLDSPASDTCRDFAKKKKRKSNRPSPNIDILSNPEQVEYSLNELGFADLIPSLGLFTARQLLSLTKADLRTDFGLRGVALWNLLHPGEQQDENTLIQYVQHLEKKIDELLLKFSSSVSPHTSPSPAPPDVLISAASQPGGLNLALPVNPHGTDNSQVTSNIAQYGITRRFELFGTAGTSSSASEPSVVETVSQSPVVPEEEDETFKEESHKEDPIREDRSTPIPETSGDAPAEGVSEDPAVLDASSGFPEDLVITPSSSPVLQEPDIESKISEDSTEIPLSDDKVELHTHAEEEEPAEEPAEDNPEEPAPQLPDAH